MNEPVNLLGVFRGAPFYFGLLENLRDCHTSDVGHWFAMTHLF